MGQNGKQKAGQMKKFYYLAQAQKFWDNTRFSMNHLDESKLDKEASLSEER